MALKYLKKTSLFLLAASTPLFFLLLALDTSGLAAQGALYASISPDRGFKVPRRESSEPLATGKFLVARGSMRDPFFSKTVIYLVDYNPLGAFGIVVNHPTKIKVSEALPAIEWLKDSPLALSWGGPVEQNRLTILVLSKEPIHGATHVSGDLYAGWDIDVFKNILKKGAGEIKAVRAYGGYAGWAPGQLAAEVMRGGWRVMDADEAHIFRDTSKLWFRLTGRP